jgi:hypothetical protein
MKTWQRFTAFGAAAIITASVMAQPQRPPKGDGQKPRPPRDEQNTQQNQEGEQPPQDRPQRGSQQARGERGPASRPSAEQCFERADKDQDGSLSVQEFKTWFENRPPPPQRGGDRPRPQEAPES